MNKFSNTKTTDLLLTFAAIAGVAGTAYYFYRKNAQLNETIVTPQVGDKLPLAQNLQTIPDQVGNYDIDGVSFDNEGVSVASDNLTTANARL